MMYLSPAPLYHAAPHMGVNLTIRIGGTAVIMERFDPENFLRLVETHRVTHAHLVPTMFSGLLKLPDEVRRRYDLSSLEIAIHAAAPCPVQIKERMIDWWGPIIHEYYGMTEMIGFTACDTAEWLAHQGTVSRSLFGQYLARHKLPQSIDFEAELPRLPTGKLYKRILRDHYWINNASHIV
jgi:long-chain acyl-CoA synthetase